MHAHSCSSSFSSCREVPGGLFALFVLSLLAGAGAWAQKAQTVNFTSEDGKTELVAYMYLPSTPGPHPAVVMLHGRGGLYST
jgi:poly(3-hydroxybutyrate) depolymerase